MKLETAKRILENAASDYVNIRVPEDVRTAIIMVLDNLERRKKALAFECPYPQNALQYAYGKTNDKSWAFLSDDQKKGFDYILNRMRMDRGDREVDIFVAFFKENERALQIASEMGISSTCTYSIIQRCIRYIQDPERSRYIKEGYSIASGELRKAELERFQLEIDAARKEALDKIEMLKNVKELASSYEKLKATALEQKQTPAEVYGEQRVEALTLKTRELNCLHRLGLHKIGDILQYRKDEFVLMPWIGTYRAERVEAALKEKGLSFCDDRPFVMPEKARLPRKRQSKEET